MCVVVGDLATTAQAQHQVERRLRLNVVIGESAAIFELLTGENQTLLVRRNTYARIHKPNHIRQSSHNHHKTHDVNANNVPSPTALPR